jgi:hypothetical protein
VGKGDDSGANYYVVLLPGTDVIMILNIFLPKKLQKLVFLTQNKAKLCKILIITLAFEKKPPIFSPKIVKNRRKL